MNVLIVDDDKLARKGLIAVIDWEQYGLCVVGDVQNGKKALELGYDNFYYFSKLFRKEYGCTPGEFKKGR